MIRCFGTDSSSSASVELMTCWPSNFRNGNSVVSLPVASRMCFASSVDVAPPAAVTCTWFGPVSVPMPKIGVILYFLNR